MIYLPLASSSHFQAPNRMRFAPIFPTIPLVSTTNDRLCFPDKISLMNERKKYPSSVQEEEGGDSVDEDFDDSVDEEEEEMSDGGEQKMDVGE